MIRFIFDGGFTDWLDAEYVHKNIGNGYDCGLTLDGEHYDKNRGYLMIDKGNCYIDFCEDAEVDEFESVLQHLEITDIEVDKMDNWWNFVVYFHPNYNCDKIAWIDDLDCALHNEIDNCCHWITIVEEGLVWDERDRDVCRAIYNNLVWGEESDLVPDDLSTYGEYIIDQYGGDIEELRDQWDDEVLAEAIENFKWKFLLSS